MTLYQYNLLGEAEQLERLWNEGVFLMYREQLPLKYGLYQLQSFYIEVKYHSEDNALQGLRTFISTNQLEPYFAQISMGG